MEMVPNLDWDSTDRKFLLWSKENKEPVEELQKKGGPGWKTAVHPVGGGPLSILWVKKLLDLSGRKRLTLLLLRNPVALNELCLSPNNPGTGHCDPATGMKEGTSLERLTC